VVDPINPRKCLLLTKATIQRISERAALRRRGIRPQWPKGVCKTKKNKGRPIKIFVLSDNKNVVSHGFKKNFVVLFVVRWERISACFDAFLSLATIDIWIHKIILVG